MGGEYALALALHLCPHGTTLYGYTHAGTARMAKSAPYHYYPSWHTAFNGKQVLLADNGHLDKWDNMEISANLLMKVSQQLPSCARLHTPENLTSAFNSTAAAPNGIVPSDLLVDVLVPLYRGGAVENMSSNSTAANETVGGTAAQQSYRSQLHWS